MTSLQAYKSRSKLLKINSYKARIHMKTLVLIVTFLFTTLPCLANSKTCENYGKFGAIRAYKSEVGTVQGSEGISYEVIQTLKSEDPFYNFIVAITDNNEDGDVWTVNYLVKTKKLNKKGKQVCKVISAVRHEETAKGQIKIFDAEETEDLENADIYFVDVAYVENWRDNYIDFRVFRDTAEYKYAQCYTGSKEEAAAVVESILNVDTGDSFILSSNITFDGDTIVHKGYYTEGSGDFEDSLDFELKKCEEN